MRDLEEHDHFISFVLLCDCDVFTYFSWEAERNLKQKTDFGTSVGKTAGTLAAPLSSCRPFYSWICLDKSVVEHIG